MFALRQTCASHCPEDNGNHKSCHTKTSCGVISVKKRTTESVAQKHVFWKSGIREGGREETPVQGGENVILISVRRTCGLKVRKWQKDWRKSHSQELLNFCFSPAIIAAVKQGVITKRAGHLAPGWNEKFKNSLSSKRYLHMLLGRTGGNESRRCIQSWAGRKRTRDSIPGKGIRDLSLLRVSRQARMCGWAYVCVWASIYVDFVRCGCFVIMCTCVYCVLYCLYRVYCIVSFINIYCYLFCLY